MASRSVWSGSPSIRGSNETLRMILLTFNIIGLTITWGVEMTYCTPYLLRLGLSKSKTSLVWIAGPLSGLVMVPIVGAITDRSTSHWGRRRPFMVWGSVIVSFWLIVLGWTGEIVDCFVTGENLRRQVTIVTAVTSIYVIDFAINAVGACSRSLIVDTLPVDQQRMGSAWATRMGAAGHIIGYFLGSLDMVKIMGSRLAETQFQIMICIAIVALLVATAVTCVAVTERRLITSAHDLSGAPFSVLSDLFKRTVNLPPRIQQICWIQFWSWIGWFPFMFYGSVWVGEVYYRNDYHDTHPASESHDTLGNVGRLGSLSLVIMSAIQFVTSIFLPYLVEASPGRQTQFSFTPRPPRSLPSGLRKALIKIAGQRPSLVTMWMLGELVYATIMISAPRVHSLRLAITFVALAGVPWCISGWVVFAEMGVEINKLASNEVGASLHQTKGRHKEKNFDEAIDIDDAEIEMNDFHHTQSNGLLRRLSDCARTDDTGTGELAGIYLGVLNVYTTLPQFVGTFICWIVFSILEPVKRNVAGDKDDHRQWLDVQKDGPNAISVCLCIGACAAVVAAEASRRLRARDNMEREG